jgi:hypothetical protein
LVYYFDEFTFRFNHQNSTFKRKFFCRPVSQAMMVDPAPAAVLKGPAFDFLADADNRDFDPLEKDRDYYICYWWEGHTLVN